MAIIDGTGDWSDDDYARSMAGSFCKQLELGLSACRVHAPRYERGPSGDGYRIRERAARAVDFLQAYRGRRLMLAGYSRGGSAAVIAARLLETAGVTVDFLFLFDPVARHLSGDSGTIPSNVGEAWVVRRRIGAPEMDKYDHSIPGWTGFDLAGHNPVRNWFGTTATLAAPGVIVRKAEFLGSHGALGGVGWPHVSEDPQCQKNVADFMNKGLVRAGLNFMLVSKRPSLTT